jgi:Delta7-sterol 5-desaturase
VPPPPFASPDIVSQRHKASASIRQQVDWINSLVHPIVLQELFQSLPTIVQSWLRNWIFSIIIYFGLNFGWAYYIYECFGGDLFPKHNVPEWSDMAEQMWVSVWALPLYSMLPAVTEEMVERGWTLSYASVSDVGVPAYVALFVLYISFVEFGVYWMHRGLHDIPAGYKCASPAIAACVFMGACSRPPMRPTCARFHSSS